MSKVKKINITIPKAKLKEMNAISDLLRQYQYMYNLVRKDMTILQFQTLKEIAPEVALDVEKGFKVYDVDMIKGEYLVKPTEDKESKLAEVDEAINKNEDKLPN